MNCAFYLALSSLFEVPELAPFGVDLFVDVDVFLVFVAAFARVIVEVGAIE